MMNWLSHAYKRTIALHQQAVAAISMIEILGVLAIGAVLIGGGVILFNTASDRAEGSNIAQSLQGFVVDMNQYLKSNYREGWVDGSDTIDEAGMQVVAANASTHNTVLAKGFNNTTTVGAGVTVTAGGIPDLPTTVGSTALSAPTQNLNMLRFTNLPSVRFYESTAPSDPDGIAEWTLYVNEETTYDLAFRLTPGLMESATTAAAATEIDMVTAGNPVTLDTLHQITATTNCPSPIDTSLPDTAVVVAIALEDIDVCQQVANRIERFDHVIESWCLDEETEIETLAEVAADDVTTQGESSLHICFGVQN